MQARMKLKKGDTVKVITGKDKGKTGKILKVIPEMTRIIVDNVNMYTRHRRARRQGQKGEKIQVAMPMNASNVLLVCHSCGKPTRVGMQINEGKRIRVCRKCREAIQQ